MNTAFLASPQRRMHFLAITIATLAPSLVIAADPAPGRLINLSVRATLTAPGDAVVAGFVLAGGGTKPVLVRGVGPALASFNVPSPLGDPTLALYSGSTQQFSNSGWSTSPDASLLASTAQRVGAFALTTGSSDAALLPSLGAGGFTARLGSQSGATGATLLEVYDASPATGPRLANLSALARAGGSAGPLIAGFVVDGDLPKRVLVRGVGPSLISLGVGGAITDPQLSVFAQGATTPMAQNDNWGGDPTLKAAFATAGAFLFASDTSRDAALVATLAPGAYTVQVGGVGNASGFALAEVYDVTPPATTAPTIALQPRSLRLVVGSAASLTVIASSASPVIYQWLKDGTPIAGATSDTLLLTSAQTADAGAYTVTVSNAAGSVVSAPATLSLAPPLIALPAASTFDLVGFATLGPGTTGGGVLATNDPNYHVLDATVPNKAQQLRTWLESTTTLVVDVQADIDLGALNNVANRPRTNPELIASGLGVINLRSNKTVFSSTGATIRHGTFNISGQNNIIVRNLRFRGLWEFDEGSQNPPDNAPWGYKIQDWDYIDIQNNARNVWIDHCDFEKSYDGLADSKLGADLITFSWCRLGGDTEGAVERQISYLEKLYQGQLTDSRVSYTFYRGLRDGVYSSQGIPQQSPNDIAAHERPHDKCNLVGASDTETNSIGYLDMTFHHVFYHDCRQRLPRMRFGNAHVFNLFVDNSGITDGTNMGTASTCNAAVFAENNYYLEVAAPFPPVSGTSPAGRATQTGCKWIVLGVDTPLTPNSFLQNPATWTWNTGTKNFSWTTAPAPNASNLPYSYRADAVDYTKTNLSSVGVIVPANATDQATLAGYLLRTSH